MMKRSLHGEPSPGRRLSTAEVAEALGVSKVHVTRLVKSGHLPAERLGAGELASLSFDPLDVEHLRAVRSGEIGDVLDRIDAQAAAADPAEDRNAYVRAAWLAAIETVAARNGGVFDSGQLRAHLPEDARGHSSGALITGLVRGRRIKWTGGYGTLNDPRARHSESPCKTYRVIGALS